MELDETVVRKTKLFDESGKRVGTVHWAAFGMVQRGSRKCVVCLMEPRAVPIRSDTGGGSAAPPPDIEVLLPWLQAHIGDWCVIHTDQARAYPGLLEQLLSNRRWVFMDSVNHGAKQWARFCTHAVEGVPGVSRVRVIAGTQLVEALWRVLKHHAIPHEVRTNPQELEAYMLAYIAERWELDDPLAELGRYVETYMNDFSQDPWSNELYLQGDAAPDAVETDAEAEE